MHRIAIDGGTLAYADGGSGKPVVLIHGFPLDHTIWDKVAVRLEPRSRVVRPDLRGPGVSSSPPGPYLMESLAADIAALLDSLGIERASIFGHSLGGFVALAFFRMFPERVAALGLIGSRAGADAPERAADREALATAAEREGIRPIVDAFIPRLFAPRTQTDDPALVMRTRALVERTDPRGAAAVLRGMAMRVDSRDLLEEIAVPFVVVAGDEDPFVDRADARSTAASVTGGVYAELPGCGHLPMLEASQPLGDALETAIARAV